MAESRINLNFPPEFLPEDADGILAAIRAQLSIEMSELQKYVADNKLSGQVLNRVSGALIASLASSVQEEGNNLLGIITAGDANAPYADVFEEGGLGSYVIQPAQKRALMFVWEDELVFFSKVVHPAAQQRQFLAPSVEEQLPHILENLEIALEIAVNNY